MTIKLAGIRLRVAAVLSAFAVGSIALSSGAAGDVKIWTESPGTMIMPDREPGKTTEIKAVGVRNEYVSEQIGLRADADDTQTYSFTASALAGPGGAQIPAAEVAMFRAANIEVKGTGGEDKPPKGDTVRARPLGSFPDALVPLVADDGTNIANAIKPVANQTVAFWVDIHVPGNAPAGDYTGKIDLKKGDAVASSVSVAVHVANVAIPADSTIPSVYNLRTHPQVLANLDEYVKVIMQHRVQPTNGHYMDVMNGRGGFAAMDKYNPGGKGWASIYVWEDTEMTADKKKSLFDNITKATQHLKDVHLFDHSFMYLHDEPHAEEVVGTAAVAAQILEQFPEWKGKLLDTLNGDHNALDTLITYHVRALKCYGGWDRQPAMDGRPEWDARRTAGEQLWFYVSNAQGVPFPTFDANTPNLGFEPRVLGWAWWYEKASGHLYWDLMDNPSWQYAHNFPPGDGQLIYPGDFTLPGAPDWVLVKDMHGPVVSRRLKIFRQGLQEWELLKVVEAKVGREKVTTIVQKVYSSMGVRTYGSDGYDPAKPMWSYSESDWDNAKLALIQLMQ